MASPLDRLPAGCNAEQNWLDGCLMLTLTDNANARLVHGWGYGCTQEDALAGAVDDVLAALSE